jgi:hypothetical protein
VTKRTKIKLAAGRLRRREIFKGLGFLFGWGAVGWAVTSLTLQHFFPYLLTGFSAPPEIFWVCLHLGIYVMPFLLILGGVPGAIQLMRRRPWKAAAIVSFTICATTWAVLTFIVVFGPSVWGWTW